MTHAAILFPELSRRIAAAFYDVFRELGHGYSEHVYQRAVALALSDEGIWYARESPVEVLYKGRPVATYRMDLIVEDAIIVECKVAKRIEPVHCSQVLSYLKATRYDLGLILNFGPAPSFKRVIYRDARQARRDQPHGTRSAHRSATSENRGQDDSELQGRELPNRKLPDRKLPDHH